MLLILLVRLINTLFSLYFIVLLIRAFLQLLGADPYQPVVQFIYRITEPLLAPLRRWTIVGNLDFSPMVVMIGLMFVQRVVLEIIYTLARAP